MAATPTVARCVEKAQMAKPDPITTGIVPRIIVDRKRGGGSREVSDLRG
jgi:hypothetical protein